MTGETRSRLGVCWLITLIVCACGWTILCCPALAAPEIANLSIRGLQSGARTTLTIEGSELLPNPRIILPLAVTSQLVKEGSTANRIQMEVTLPAEVMPGHYYLRLANRKGISNPVMIAVDGLAQSPFVTRVGRLPVALHGSLPDGGVLQTSFVGHKGQRVVVDVQARRLGSPIDPVLSLSDPHRLQVAWSQGHAAFMGDARLEAVLPADGLYTIDLHDALYRAFAASYFCLKIGELHYADLVFPLGARRETRTSFELIGNVFPPGTRVNADLRGAWSDIPAPLPTKLGLTGAAPRIMVCDFPEIFKQDLPRGKLQEVSVPAVINGRVSRPHDEDRYRLLVKPGMRLRFDAIANRAGSPLDGVLSLQTDAGNPVAQSDDRPDTIDPGFDYSVPDGTTKLVVALRDLLGRGGPNYVYRLAITPLDHPDYSLTVLEDRVHIPRGGAALVRVRAARAGYNGPIKLLPRDFPAGIVVSGDEIPAAATEALLTLSAPADLGFSQSLIRIDGEGKDRNVILRRPALVPESVTTQLQPWLRGEVGLAVIEPVAIALDWAELGNSLTVGSFYPAKVRASRAQGVAGPIRLTLLTSQIVPTVRRARQKRESSDLSRAIRLLDTPTIGAGQAIGTAKIFAPADLPIIAYDLAVEGELMSPDGQIIAKATTPSRRIEAAFRRPLALFDPPMYLVRELSQGGGKATLEQSDTHSGRPAVKVLPDQVFNSTLQDLRIRIRQYPGPGEYRFLRFAWKKKGGQSICLQLSHDGKWGPIGDKAARFRYRSGPGPERFGGSLLLEKSLPLQWTVVTRDLYADFGEFTLTGIALGALDGEYALFDDWYVGATARDFEVLKPSSNGTKSTKK
jgi:hypothetical protein